MIANTIISKLQKFFEPIYDKSFVLKNLDWLILVNIILVIITSAYAQSDNIGYFALFAIILTVVKLLTKSGEKFELNLADKFLLLYFIFVLISVAGSTLLYLSIKGFFKTVTYLGFYIAVVHFFRNNIDKIKYVFFAIISVVFFETIVAFFQNFGAVEEISGWQDMSRLNPEDVMTRVYGTLKPLNPNLFGGYMLAAIPSIIVLPFINKRLVFLSIFIGLAAIIALFLTGCRGAYIGLFFEVVVLFFMSYRFLSDVYRKVYTFIVGIFSLIVGFVIISISSIRARIFSIFAMRSDSSNSFRFNVYNSSLSMFKDNWLLGIGCGNQNFREIYGLYMKTGFDALSAYNIYLETAVESGIFALISFVLFIVSNLVAAFKFVLNTRQTETVFVTVALISIVGMLFHGIVDTVFFRPQIQFIFWIMIGIIRVCVK